MNASRNTTRSLLPFIEKPTVALLGVALALGLAGASCGHREQTATVEPQNLRQVRPIPQRCTSFGGRPGIARAVPVPAPLFVAPVQAVHDAANGLVYVVELTGTIRRFPAGDPNAEAEPVVDLSHVILLNGEDGLLGMALERIGDVTNLIVKFIAPPLDGETSSYARTVVARLISHDGGRSFDPTSMQPILSIDLPGRNHRGGPPVYGPDGMLYVPTGDGGFDTKRSSQDPTLLLGKILRIDTRSGTFPYAIPPDNPFVNTPGVRPEIFASGFRNPFGWSFDPDAAQPVLWVGDVGESRREELDRVEAGGNFGWPIFEGDLCLEGPCSTPGLAPPVYTYENSGANAIVGGPVYRGTRFPELRGRVIIGDNVTGRFEAISREPGKPDPILLDQSGLYILGMGEDADGELTLLDYSGKIWTLERRAPGTVATRLSETGCVDMTTPTRAANGLLPYDVNMPLWSDGTDKARSLSLPAGTSLRTLDDGSFEVPVGGVLVKTFFWHDKPIETRLLIRHPEGDWAGYSYEWREDGSEADLLEHGKRRDFGDLTWMYPSRSQCLACHTEAAGRTLGLQIAQLNRDIEIDGKTVDQLPTWQSYEILDRPLGDPTTLPRFPKRESAASSEWARAYLHANCSHCHRPGGSGFGRESLLASATVRESGCDEVPLGDTFGVADPRFIAPGRPESSLALQRMLSGDAFARMPPMGTSRPDDLAASIVSDWIRSLSTCDGN